MLTCPRIFDVNFGRLLVAELGGDAGKIQDDWCWREFAAEYPGLREAAERYFAAAKTGDPALAAYWMALYYGSSREWAEKIKLSSRKLAEKEK